MKLFVFALSMLFAGNVIAAEKNPSVFCDVRCAKASPGSIDLTKKNNSGNYSCDGFEIEAYLSEICAADGGPCVGSELTVSAKNGNQESTSDVAVTDGSFGIRILSTSITADGKTVRINCDLEEVN